MTQRGVQIRRLIFLPSAQAASGVKFHALAAYCPWSSVGARARIGVGVGVEV
jgi:hypothetical protein